MMLIETIKSRFKEAMKAKRDVEKELLRVAIGEIQMAELRGDGSGDALALAVLKKLAKSNEETLSQTSDPAQREQLVLELGVLKELLPPTLGVDAIATLLEPVTAAIRAATNDGQATGVAIKHLKSAGAAAEGQDVSAAVRLIRGAG